MLRFAYTCVLWLALPWVLVRLWWRARRQPGYRAHLGERFGAYAVRTAVPAIWVHMVSVGETRAAAPLVDALRLCYPDHELLLTCMTPTGRAAAVALYGATARVVYLPYDYPFAARRFLRHFRPRLCILMETEIWPNLLAICAHQSIPVLLANARLSERSARRYRRFAALARPAMATLAQVGAQSAQDAARLSACGVRHVVVTGNLKFDVVPDTALIRQGRSWRTALDGRRVVLAASTREGEEDLLLRALRPLVDAGHLLLLVPRHPQRFDDVAALTTALGYAVARRSTTAPPAAATQVWLGDSMGEMAAYYSAADCAYVGGSLLPFGGQNLIEAAACGCPVLVGPHTWNFAQAAEDAILAGAALRVADAQGAAVQMTRLIGDDILRARMAEAARRFAAAHQGATERTMALIAPLL